VPFNAINAEIATAVVPKGEYEKIKKKSEGGIYSDVLVDFIHFMMHLVYLFIYLFNFSFSF
jgi:hypothetical protein